MVPWSWSWPRLSLTFLLLLVLLLPPPDCYRGGGRCRVPAGVKGQRTDQTYILIRPHTLVISENRSKGVVQVVCRQIPRPSSSVTGQSLQLRRTLLIAGIRPIPELLADLEADDDMAAVHNTLTEASGDVNKELVVLLMAVSCSDARFTYTCRAVLSNNLNNSASATFRVVAPQPKLTARPMPLKSIYERTDELILTCSPGTAVVGLRGVRGSPRGRWVWEFNDLGGWRPVNPRDVRGGALTVNGPCFWKSQPSLLNVKPEDFAVCSRRFRCYFQDNSDTVMDSPGEVLVDMGYDCMDGLRVLGTDPFVAIASMLTVVAVICLVLYVCLRISRKRGKKKKRKMENAISNRILSPMTPSQRDRLLKKRMEKQADEGETALVSLQHTTLSDSSVLDPSEEQEVSNDEDEDEDQKKETKKKKIVVKVVQDISEELDDDELESTSSVNSDVDDD